jgi:hypothetical protein
LADGIKPFGGRDVRRWRNSRYRRVLSSQGDVHWGSVVFLMDMEGTDAGQDAVDASTGLHALTWNTIVLDDAQAKFGTTSLLNNGTAANYLQKTSTSAEDDFGTADFTVEFHWRPAALNINQVMIGTWTTTDGWWVKESSTGFLQVGFGNTVVYSETNASAGISVGNWYHIAVAREGTNLRVFVDGTQIGADVTDSTDIQSTVVLKMMSLDGTQQGANGWLDNVRITKGVARYTSNFTAPTEAYPTE